MINIKTPLHSLFIPGMALLLLMATGCSMLETGSEQEARLLAEKVTAGYRPLGKRPPLPVLAKDAPLENYLRYAALNSPEVESAYHDWISSVSDITVARSYPDPRLTLEFYIMGGIPSIMPGLMFDIPGPGKLTAAADITAADSRMKYYSFMKAVLQAVFDLEKACWELRYLNRKIELMKDNLGLVREFEVAAQTRAQAGIAPLTDVLTAQIEEERIENEIRNLEDSQRPLLEKFKASLGLGAEDPVPPIPANLPDAKADETWAKEFLDEAFRKNPGLQALKAGVEEADASLSLARKANIPDFTAGVEMDVLSAPVIVRPSGSMTLPIWRDKISAMIASAEAKRKSAGARLSAAQISLAVDFAEKSYMTREASRNIILFDEKLIPKSRLFVSIATTSYANGAIDFNTLLDAERMLLALEIGKIGAVLQNNVSTADMILLVIGRMPPSTLADEVGQTDQNNLTGGEK